MMWMIDGLEHWMVDAMVLWRSSGRGSSFCLFERLHTTSLGCEALRHED